MAIEAKKAVSIVIALLVASVMVAYVLPIGIGAVNDDVSASYNQSVGDEVEVSASLNGTVDSVGTDTATVTVDNDGDTSTTSAITVGENETVSVGGTDVTVAVDSVGSSSATIVYSYPTTTGWGTGAAALFGLIPLLLVLVPFSLLALWATDVF